MTIPNSDAASPNSDAASDAATAGNAVEPQSTGPDKPWIASYPKHADWHDTLPEHPLSNLLDETVDRFAAKPAFDFLGASLSYGELGVLVNKAAKGLQQLGVEKGTRVALLLPNCPAYPVFYYGILKAGGTVVNCNPLYTTGELTHKFEDSEPLVLVTLDLKALWEKSQILAERTSLAKIIVCPFADYLPATKRILFKLFKGKEIARGWQSHPQAVAYDDVIDNDGAFDRVEIDPRADVAVIQYTGGTTGEPKGAMLSHANLYANTIQAERWFDGFEYGAERMMAVIPFFHVFAMTGALNLGIRVGAEIIALPRFEINDLMKTIARRKPTILPAVPTIFTAINHHKNADKIDMHAIKACISGGAPLPREVHDRFAALTGAELVEGYGLTESSPVATVNPVDGTARIGTIGLPMIQTEIIIVSLEDGKTRMPTGERGEICIRGPQVMLGYWNKPEATAEAIDAEGFLHTGDVGTMDEDGFITIVDRIKDLILAGGFNVYPRNVEEAIYQHPAIEECVVGGVPDSYRGETVKAWIKCKEGESLDENALRSFLKDRLSPIEMPKQIEFRSEPLPKTLIGKLSRKDLVDEAKKLAAQP